MRRWIPYAGASLALLGLVAAAQSPQLHFPETVVAGVEFSVPTFGSGSATLCIIGPSAVLQKKVQLGKTITFATDDLHNAGRYVAILTDGSSVLGSEQFDVTSSPRPSSVSFLAKPSRLPVNMINGISGVTYLFDDFGNLVLQPQQVSFDLGDAGRELSRTVRSEDGVAWTRMNSGPKAGPAHFRASTANIREDRIVQQVAGDPCTIRMTARAASSQRVVLETDPIRDCSGNAVNDGTIVTFSETYDGHQQAIIDVPIKRGVARAELAAPKGAVISVAAGVVMGNEIRWGGGL